MRIIKHIVESCSECPYKHITTDMGARIEYCQKTGINVPMGGSIDPTCPLDIHIPEIRCGFCNEVTGEWVVENGVKYCPKCHQDMQELGILKLTRHANVHNCVVCGDRIGEYGVKNGDEWLCMKHTTME